MSDPGQCPYCRIKTSRLKRHIELRHREMSMRKFLMDARVTVVTGLLLLIAALLILMDIRTELLLPLPELFMLAAIVVGGVPLAKEGLEDLIRERDFDVDLLVVVAAIGAVLIDYPGEGAALIFLFSVAETLEDYSVFSSRRTLKGLMDLSPGTAVVEREEEREVPVEEVQVGEIVLIRPGERVPVDGRVVSGRSSVNQAPITGESMPVEKEEGDEVFAGTLNQEGVIHVESTRRTEDSTLSKIVDLIEEEEGARSPTEMFVDRFAGYYTPLMLVLAVLVATLPPLALEAPFQDWMYRALVLLVISCPCAFVISTPVTIFSAITSSARRGVLIKGGSFIEELREVRTVVFDKTGTLTRGTPEVTDVLPVEDMGEDRIMRLSASLEKNSTHPLAPSIISRYQEFQGPALLEVEDFRSLPGRGISGVVEGKTHYLGSPAMFDMSPYQGSLESLSDQGKTVLVLGNEEGPLGIIAVEDTVRDGAAEVISDLRARGIRTVMLTGDNEDTARKVAERLGLDEYRAELMPRDKLYAVDELGKEGKVAMVGDGVNDAPALVRSDVGIAMGAAGSDTAMESADIALMEDDLSKILYLLDQSGRAMRVIRFNIYSSIGVKAVLAAFTFLGMVTLWIAVGVGDVGMALLVTLNAILLGRYSQKE
ncbi:MAG: heavy metal translocating P-type ATPase [Methanomassiliicoccales archaeon]